LCKIIFKAALTLAMCQYKNICGSEKLHMD
jgi:hypothetical protein